jgi:hypothetical protein
MHLAVGAQMPVSNESQKPTQRRPYKFLELLGLLMGSPQQVGITGAKELPAVIES